MRVCLCDNCTKQVKEKEIRYILFDVEKVETKYTFQGHNMAHLELCESCFNNFMKFMAGEQNAI